MNETRIPIHNIFYLLCYAWDHLEVAGEIKVASVAFDNSANLFARFLDAGIAKLMRLGFRSDYVEQAVDVSGPKGKIDIGNTLKRALIAKGRVHCIFDAYTPDVPMNRILKATLTQLLRANGLSREHDSSIRRHLSAMGDIADVSLCKRDFALFNLGREKPIYHFLISLCELLFDISIPDESAPGRFHVPEFFEDERKMAVLFEAFVRNFYRHEQTYFSNVSAETLAWDAIPLAAGAEKYLPVMRTDITLSRPGRTLIVDTKFYPEVFSKNRFGGEKIHSDHLYQLTCYLMTKKRTSPHAIVEGLLLYPSVGRTVRLSYQSMGNPLSVATVDLSRPWTEIHDELLSLIRDRAERAA